MTTRKPVVLRPGEGRSYPMGRISAMLWQARANFLKFGACEEVAKQHARRPTEDEPRLAAGPCSMTWPAN